MLFTLRCKPFCVHGFDDERRHRDRYFRSLQDFDLDTVELSEIKKQYRKLSLKYHPDRNIGDPIAEMFVKISKAHDVLTDDEARENYEKYGNPDGRQARNCPSVFLHSY